MSHWQCCCPCWYKMTPCFCWDTEAYILCGAGDKFLAVSGQKCITVGRLGSMPEECWQLCRDSEKVTVLPAGAIVLEPSQAQIYPHCNACCPAAGCWFHASLCWCEIPPPPFDVYVPCDSVTGTCVFQYGGVCYFVNDSGTPVQTLPPGAVVVDHPECFAGDVTTACEKCCGCLHCSVQHRNNVCQDCPCITVTAETWPYVLDSCGFPGFPPQLVVPWSVDLYNQGPNWCQWTANTFIPMGLCQTLVTANLTCVPSDPWGWRLVLGATIQYFDTQENVCLNCGIGTSVIANIFGSPDICDCPAGDPGNIQVESAVGLDPNPQLRIDLC